MAELKRRTRCWEDWSSARESAGPKQVERPANTETEMVLIFKGEFWLLFWGEFVGLFVLISRV